jgi:hypothetical protein
MAEQHTPTDDNPERECVSCGQRGHWYLHCQQRPFWPAVAEHFGLPPLPSNVPTQNTGGGKP